VVYGGGRHSIATWKSKVVYSRQPVLSTYRKANEIGPARFINTDSRRRDRREKKNSVHWTARHFCFSILQRLSPDLEAAEAGRMEETWKRHLQIRKFGLNRN
jgi:hypothetical protein